MLFQEYISTAFLIFMAELGDKTHWLALLFALRFSTGQVLLGIAAGSFLNHGLAVLLGFYLGELLPAAGLRGLAGLLFLGFALWTLRDAGSGGGAAKPRRALGPVFTVAAAFFLGEFGDKTQLTAMALAAAGRYPAGILAGSVSGMVVSGFTAIWVGRKIGHRIPATPLKLFSAATFALWGTVLLALEAPGWARPGAAVLAAGYAVLFCLWARPVWRRWRTGEYPPLRQASDSFYVQLRTVGELLQQLRRAAPAKDAGHGPDESLQAAAAAVDKALAGGPLQAGNWAEAVPEKQQLPREETALVLAHVLSACRYCPGGEEQRCILQFVRRTVEALYLGRVLSFAGNAAQYIESVSQYDPALAADIASVWNAVQRKGELPCQHGPT